jgi:hypothetical protein
VCRDFNNPSPITFHTTGSCVSSAMDLKPKTKDYLTAVILFYNTNKKKKYITKVENFSEIYRQ